MQALGGLPGIESYYTGGCSDMTYVRPLMYLGIPIGWMISAVLGVPAMAVLRSRSLLNPFAIAATGGMIGLVAMLPVKEGLLPTSVCAPGPEYYLYGAFFGASGALIYWLIAVRGVACSDNPAGDENEPPC